MLGWMKHKLESNCWEKYQQPKICRWHQPYGRKQRKTKESLRESERGERKNCLKTQHSNNENHGIQSHQFSPVQSLSCVQLFAMPWPAERQASLSITNSWSLLKPMSIELVMPSNHLIVCYPFLLLPSIFPSIRVFSNESVLPIRWPKYWNFSFSISPSDEYSALISFRIDWFDLLAAQETLKSLLQHHSSKASMLQCSAFFMSNSHIHTWLLEKP